MAFRLSFNTISFILILVSFVFLLLSVISSPVVTQLNVGKTASHTYGVFGYCWDNNSQCSSATYPLQLSTISDSSTNWKMSSGSRDILAKIFIITPIALGFNFILLMLIIVSHFTSRGIVLVGIGINIISAILTIISCVVTVLAFYPNLAWTGWILIGSAAANLVSFIFLILTLTIMGNDSDEDEDFDEDEAGFGKFSNYNKLDDKFNHIQTSTSKNPNSSSSIENDYEYKPYGGGGGGGGVNNGNGFTSNRNPNPISAPNSEKVYGKTNTFTSNPTAYTNYSTSNPNISNNMQPQGIRKANGSFHSNSSSYYVQPQSVHDFTQGQTGSPSLGGSSSNVGYKPVGSSSSTPGSNLSNNPATAPQPPATTTTTTTPYPAIGDTPQMETNTAFSRSVFEHHPQVEGHKPFTELEDDFDDEEDLNAGRNNVAGTGNDSDEDSDFTSVSQRAPNPQYNYNSGYGQGSYYQQQYSNIQQYQHMNQVQPQMLPQTQLQPHFQLQQSYNNGSNGYFAQNQPPIPQQQVAQMSHASQQRPTISENALNSNPDFNFQRGTLLQQKRRVAPGFVPVAARYNGNAAKPGMGANNTNAQASSLMGRNGGPYGVAR
ncbi:hypothetical protein KGF56_002813 [Candida oxycetoniae]|uniref:PH-response regulator protein palI/RIM9 n=1 Tax=Candida oxycetoniae TaxID=497107 RepID=A0AAI9SXA2_9ASCO|nr:uncharacterized protein KGF56_002813 [Candida oxycetoniae]KAI3404416.2 hypothetical protein KGF56_002813 [Candida oxycetoniae]